jgi:hypothetical protein
MTCARNPDLDPICRSTALAPMPATTRGRSPDRHPPWGQHVRSGDGSNSAIR